MSDIVVNITPPAPIELLYTQGGAVGPQGPTGATGGVGPTNRLVVGTVTSGTAASATISAQTVANGTATQTINLVLPQGATGSQGIQGNVGPAGPSNVLSIGSVATTSATTAAVSISGTSPSQVISFVVPRGPQGIQGDAGPYTVVQVGGVTTGAAGTSAKVDSVTSGGTVTLSFTIPRGLDGTANLADETPQPLGVASVGSALTAARADHVHSTPTIAFGSLTGVPLTFSPSAHTHAVTDVTNLQAALDSKQPAGSYATLVNGAIPSSMLPGFVDDVIEYASLSAFPATNDVGKLFTAIDTRKIYRWSGTGYVEISPSPGTTTDVPEGSNLYYTNARAAAAAPVQSVAGRTGTISLTKSDVGLGNVDNTADTAKPVSTATQAALDGKAATSHTHSLSSLTQSSATTGQVVTWNGTAWAAATPSGGGSGSIVEATTAAGFPSVGSAQTLYHATDVRRIYFWDSSSSVYIEAGPSGGGGSGSGGDGTDSVLRALFVPPAPTSVSATAANSQASVVWTAPTGVISQAPVLDYVVQYQPRGGSWTTFSEGTSTATSATVTGLTNGTDYFFRVAAVNAAGTGAYSSASTAVTPSSGVAIAYLVVAGGGSGGHSMGGGGGAGGMLTGTGFLNFGDTTVVTVGSGAAGATGNWVPGSAGVASSFGSSLVATGGGYGGGSAANGGSNKGGNGGSGGGVGSGYPKEAPGSGVAGQGNAGGTCTDSPSGGGGGAGGVGGNGASNAGAGGSGLAWINGVTYASGGGGGSGSGGGDSGSQNTGGGGGGGGDVSYYVPTGAGGSGVVIIRTATTAASTTGSPTVTQSDGYNWYKFTGSGSITF